MRSFLITLIFGGFLLTLHWYKTAGNGLADQIKTKDSVIRNLVLSVPKSAVQIVNLQNEFDVIQNIKQPYLFMGISATTMWYALTGLFVYTSVITAILAFLVGKKGWDNTESFLKSTFLVFVFSSTYFGLAPLVFNNKETGKYNLAKFSYFNQQQLLIYDKIKIYKDPKTVIDLKSLDNAIDTIDSNVRANQDFYFDIDQNKVPDQKTLIKNIGL